MIDDITSQPLTVATDDGQASYIIVPMRQLKQVTDSLDAGQISYWVDEEAISIDGQPEIIYINFGEAVDPARVQQLIDCIQY